MRGLLIVVGVVTIVSVVLLPGPWPTPCGSTRSGPRHSSCRPARCGCWSPCSAGSSRGCGSIGRSASASSASRSRDWCSGWPSSLLGGSVTGAFVGTPLSVVVVAIALHLELRRRLGRPAGTPALSSLRQLPVDQPDPDRRADALRGGPEHRRGGASGTRSPPMTRAPTRSPRLPPRASSGWPSDSGSTCCRRPRAGPRPGTTCVPCSAARSGCSPSWPCRWWPCTPWPPSRCCGSSSAGRRPSPPAPSRGSASRCRCWPARISRSSSSSPCTVRASSGSWRRPRSSSRPRCSSAATP